MAKGKVAQVMRDVRSGGAARGSGRSARRGFTLIEVVVAMFILLVVLMSVFSLVSASVTSLRNSDMLEMAKNVATYTMEYIRSRNVTLDNNFLSTTDWYSTSNSTGKYPGLADLGSNPVEANPTALSINTNPATPDKTWATASTAFYSSLQGFVSLKSTPSNGNPSSEDGNAKVTLKKYYDIVTGAPYVVRFPGVPGGSGSIANFTALSGYNAKIYTNDANRMDTSKPEYDPHYTSTKTGTDAYRGFRVLTQIAARRNTANPNHVYYYDVRVTVLWMVGGRERSYSMATQLAAYGAGT